MSTTPILDITEMEASQSQPELVFNEAIRKLEAMSPLIVLDRDLSTPPVSPDDGDRYIVADGGTGDWAGHDGEVALYTGAGWLFLVPRTGWLAFVDDENIYAKYTSDSPAGWMEYLGS